jgi:short-subunit dehydrogenase
MNDVASRTLRRRPVLESIRRARRLTLKPLHQQVLVITGATSGIGLSTARLAGRAGARVVLAARSQQALARLESEILSAGGKALAVVADVSLLGDVERVAAEARRQFGGFDTWVNNAAVSAYGSSLDVSLDDMRRIMDTNFWGVVHGSRVACHHLRQHGGALINLGSVLSDRAVPFQGAYSASKHAIKAWTDALRDELTYEGAPVSVTLIKPAAVDTPYAEHAHNYFADHPRHVPPVYSAHSAARAILYAASHPTRDVVVGSSSRLLSLGSLLMPKTVDRFMTRLMVPAMHSGRPPHGRANLYRPSECLEEDGTYPGLVRPSIYTALVTHPTAVRRAAAAATLLIGAALVRQLSSSAGKGR